MNKFFSKKSRLIATIATTFMVCGAVFGYHSMAAGYIEDRECTVGITIPEDVVADIAGCDGNISGHLYQIGEVSESGNISSNLIDASKLSSSTTAETMEELVADATEKVSGDGIEMNFSGEELSATVNKGLYLVVIDEAVSPSKIYKFTNFIISAPSNEYYTTGNDDWLYEIKLQAKHGVENRYGNLVINKSVPKFYNVDNQPASFVFSVVAQLDGETVYDDVVSVDFSEAGSKSIELEHIPATAEVTVKEVYSGASYVAGTGDTQTTTIVADTTIANENVASVSFENDYDGTFDTGSNSITNQFQYDDESSEYVCHQIKGGVSDGE